MIMSLVLTARSWFLLGFIACFSMIMAALWFQYVEGLEPCPLCISQRIMIIAMGLVFIIAALHNPAQTGRRVYAVVGCVMALLGAGVSARHVWIQNLPPEKVPECGPGLAYVFEYFPFIDTLKLLLSGTGECAEVLWTLFGLSMPAWTLIAFISLASLSLVQFWNPLTRNAL